MNTDAPKPVASRKAPKNPTRAVGRRDKLTVLEDVSAITATSGDLAETLRRVVEIIAERTGTDVCSVYLLDVKRQQLTLSATSGLQYNAVGRVSMGVGEGLTGMVIEKFEPVAAVDAITHPRFKFFPETGEERFHSFVGVPIGDKTTPLGVLVVQTLRRRKFSRTEMRLLKAITTQVGGIIVQARLLEDLQSMEQERREDRRKMAAAVKKLKAYEETIEQVEESAETAAVRQARLSGLPAAPGFGRGRAHLLQPPVSFADVTDSFTTNAERECERFAKAVAESAVELETLKVRLARRLPEFDAGIITAHRLMLEDHTLNDRVEQLIRGERLVAEAALKRVVDEVAGQFAEMTDEYLRERAADVRDVGVRVLRNLMGVAEPERALDDDSVLVADEITLSDLTLIDHEHLRGIAMATGGVAAHASILAKSFEIPTVVGADGLLDHVHEGDDLIVDGSSGVVYVNPPALVVREYDRLGREYREFNRGLDAENGLAAETTDGRRIGLFANIGLLADLVFAHRHGAEGIGLYRTEFPFLTYREPPDEDEQFQLYCRIIRGMEGKVVTIRTLDVGADKFPSYLTLDREENPFLGWRSIRVSLETPDLFRTQLRAILRAAVFGRVRIMFPMISSIEEIRRTKEILEEAKEGLRRDGIDFDPGVPIGVMIEVPSAVAIATHLIREVDFFSIGTNDLVQYVLAVDRNNHKVAQLYEPLHPAVLGALHQTVQAAQGAGKRVGICGEMASDPLATLVLLGLGFDDLSMGPFFVPVVRHVVRQASYAEARKIARDVLTLPTVKEVKGHLFDAMKSLGLLELLEMYH